MSDCKWITCLLGISGHLGCQLATFSTGEDVISNETEASLSEKSKIKLVCFVLCVTGSSSDVPIFSAAPWFSSIVRFLTSGVIGVIDVVGNEDRFITDRPCNKLSTW